MMVILSQSNYPNSLAYRRLRVHPIWVELFGRSLKLSMLNLSVARPGSCFWTFGGIFVTLGQSNIGLHQADLYYS